MSKSKINLATYLLIYVLCLSCQDLTLEKVNNNKKAFNISPGSEKRDKLNILKFKDSNHFYSTLDSLYNLPIEERLSYKNTLGFSSMAFHQKVFNDKVELCKDKKEYERLLNL